MAINAAETPVLNDCSHVKSCQSPSTQPSVISGLTSAFWPCFIRMGGVSGHPLTDPKKEQSSQKQPLLKATFPEVLYIPIWDWPEQEQN